MDESFSFYLKLVGYGITIFSFIQIMMLAFLRRGEFLSDLRGIDSKWQLVEFAAVIWCIIFPTVIVVDILGVHIGPEIWLSLDALFMANLGKKSFDKYVEHRYKNKEETTSENTDNEEQIK